MNITKELIKKSPYSYIEEKYLIELGFKKLMNDFFFHEGLLEYCVSKEKDGCFRIGMWLHCEKIPNDIQRDSIYIYSHTSIIETIPTLMLTSKKRMKLDLEKFIFHIK